MSEETPMNDSNNPQSSNVDPANSSKGDGHVEPHDGQLAERYIHNELEQTRGSLVRTQVGSVAVALLLCGYMIYLTSTFRKNLEPQAAATIAQGIASQKIEEQGPELASYVKREVPAYIRKAPDYALEQLPKFRQQIQTEVDNSIQKYAKESGDQLSAQIDKFLEENKEPVGELLKQGQDPKATEEINAKLKELFVQYMETTQVGGETLKAKLDSSLEMLNKVDARMKRLAEAKDLSPQEQSAKRAIAVLLKTVNDKRVEEGKTEPLAKDAADAVKSAMPQN